MGYMTVSLLVLTALVALRVVMSRRKGAGGIDRAPLSRRFRHSLRNGPVSFGHGVAIFLLGLSIVGYVYHLAQPIWDGQIRAEYAASQFGFVGSYVGLTLLYSLYFTLFGGLSIWIYERRGVASVAVSRS